MNGTGKNRLVSLAIVALLAAPVMAADKPDPRKEAEVVVQAFNAAFGRKDMEGIAATLIEGGVQFDLRPAHADQTEGHQIIQELRARWYGVTPILFAAAESYARKVEIIDSRAAPDMATVWARISTEMRSPGSAKPVTNTFTEVYFLVRTQEGWKIGAMMDDRATDAIRTAGPPA